MKHIQDLLKRFTQQAQFSNGLVMAQLKEIWPEVVGPFLAQYVKPQSCEKGVLFCHVNHPALLQELSFMEHQLLPKLQQYFPDLKLTQLKWSLSSNSQGEQKAFNQNKQQEQERKQRYQLELETIELPHEVQMKLEKAVASLEDEEVRQRALDFLMTLGKRQHLLAKQKWSVCQQCHSFFEPGSQNCRYCQSRIAE